MFVKCVTLLLLLFPVVSLPQSINTVPVGKEDVLLPALLSVKTGDQSTASALLKDHKHLITRRLCDALLQAATMSSGPGDTARPLFLYGIAKEAAKQLEDKKLLALIFYKTGRAHFEQDHIERAIEEYLQSKRLFEEARSPRDLIYVLSELGTLHIFAADYKKAKEYSEQSLALAGSLNGSEPAAAMPDEYGIAFARSNLGQVAKWEGDYDTAITHFQKSLELWKELRRRGFWSAGNMVDALGEIGHVYQAMGDHLQAFNYLSQAMEIAKTLLNRNRVAGVLNDIGVLYIEQGDYLKASESLNRSLRIFTELNNRREVARNLLNIGVISYRRGNHKAALEEFQKSLDKAQEIDAAEIIVAAEEGLGSVHLAQSNYQEALEQFDKAWSLAERIGDKIRHDRASLAERAGLLFAGRLSQVR